LNLNTLDDVQTDGKHALLRIDVNSPIDPGTGRILDKHRFNYHRETLRELEDAAVSVLAHQSRPGKDDFSNLERHADALEKEIGRPVKYVGDYFGPAAREAVENLGPGEVLLLENVRFYSEENMCSLEPGRMAESHPVRALSPLVDLYVNDAFACAHRNQISIAGFPEALPAAAGRLMEREIEALEKAAPGPGTLFLLGGAKIDDSLKAARNVLEKGSRVAATGLFANLLLQAKGVDLGEKSEEILRNNGSTGLLEEAENLLEKHGDEVLLPVDLAVEDDGERVELSVDELPSEKVLSDIGLETISRYTEAVQGSDAVVANGPSGIFEEKLFALGTNELFKSMAQSSAFTVLGGGHVVAALRRTGLDGRMDHVSSGGGALLTQVSGEKLPGLEALRKD